MKNFRVNGLTDWISRVAGKFFKKMADGGKRVTWSNLFRQPKQWREFRNRWEMDAFPSDSWQPLTSWNVRRWLQHDGQRIMQISLGFYRIITLKKSSKVHWKFRRVDEYFSEKIPARRWWRHRRPKKAAEIEKNYSEKRPLRSKNAFLISCRRFPRNNDIRISIIFTRQSERWRHQMLEKS